MLVSHLVMFEGPSSWSLLDGTVFLDCFAVNGNGGVALSYIEPAAYDAESYRTYDFFVVSGIDWFDFDLARYDYAGSTSDLEKRKTFYIFKGKETC